MARRRYLSTEVSSDPKLVELAERAGPWSVVLYTWLIPHAEDDASVSADPGKLKLQVVPAQPTNDCTSQVPHFTATSRI
jgi:hypothetical protein